MTRRRGERRVRMRLQVRLWGMDYSGKLFNVSAHTVDLTPTGARLEGVTCFVERGMIIGVEHGRSRARFRVRWVGRAGTPTDGQIGIRSVEPGKYIWGVAFGRTMGDEPDETHMAADSTPAAPSPVNP